MLLVVLGYGLVFLSVYLQLYYWFGWTKMQNKNKVKAICKVIIFRTLGGILCAIAMFVVFSRTLLLFATCTFAFVLLLYDVWRLKIQIDETTKYIERVD